VSILASLAHLRDDDVDLVECGSHASLAPLHHLLGGLEVGVGQLVESLRALLRQLLLAVDQPQRHAANQLQLRVGRTLNGVKILQQRGKQCAIMHFVGARLT